MLWPADSTATVLFFGAPGLSFDLASFSFQVPRFGFWAKPSVRPAKQVTTVRIIVLVFMLSPRSDRLPPSRRAILVASTASCQDSGHRWVGTPQGCEKLRAKS